MTVEIPQYGLRAYALFYTKHSSTEEFGQRDLEWIVGQSMRKKIFSLLLRTGWIRKKTRGTYVCLSPDKAVKGLLNFRVPGIIRRAERPYALTGMSAIEIWSDYSYVQRGIEKSPYFMNVLKKDVRYWKAFFSGHDIPLYINEGTTIGEYVILKPVNRFAAVEKGGFSVIDLQETEKLARANGVYSYAYDYMRQKYGSATNKGKRSL